MPVALQAHFDPVTHDFVRGLWKKLGAAGIPCRALEMHHIPHLTFLYGGTSARDLSSIDLKDAPLSAPVLFREISTFGSGSGVVHLPVDPSPHLLHWHRWLAGLGLFAPLDPLYEMAAWRPHCTLASRLNVREMTKALDCLAPTQLPLAGRCISLNLVSYPDATVLASLPLE